LVRVIRMPAATPLPRGPSVLTLYSAWDLLTAPGCPVCRYAAEAGDRYLGWFALEGHAQPGLIATLGRSLGMCAAHSRALTNQPGAALRLTVVYRYVVMAARDRLAAGPALVAACPACEHDNAASGRALETLLEGFDDGPAASRCRDLGGLCIPHLAAASGRARRPAITCLAETMREALAADGENRIGWLAGTDYDAEPRAGLRASIPGGDMPVPGACAACLAAARAERASLARLPVRAGARPADESPADAGPADAGPADAGLADNSLAMPPLCASHLADAATSAAKTGGLLALLTTQAAATIARTRPGRGRWRPAARHGDDRHRCPVCQERGKAEHRVLAGMSGNLRESRGVRRAQPLCVRHHLALRAVDKQAGEMAAREAAGAADRLFRELAEEFERTTWARHRGAPWPEPATWRRAVAFLDGAVFVGNPPPR
jgi:hypothetical protein